MFQKWKRKTIGMIQRARVRFPFLSLTSLQAAYRFAQMIEIVRILRGPHGCPWDRVQSLEDMLPYLREEALEAVLAGHDSSPHDADDFASELGDLHFVILFLARIYEEQGSFTIADALGSIVDKMVRRHPHVFRDAPRDRASIKATWQKIKAQERKKAGKIPQGFASILDGAHSSWSALDVALDVSRAVVKVGFEWPDVWDVWAKLEEELEELREVMPPRQNGAPIPAQLKERQRDELGDLLFTLVNLGRHLGIDSEQALRVQCLRFTRRFQYIERALYDRGESLEAASLDTLEALWQEGKRAVG